MNDESALAVLSAVSAALHSGAAVVAAPMVSRSRHPGTTARGPAHAAGA